MLSTCNSSDKFQSLVNTGGRKILCLEGDTVNKLHGHKRELTVGRAGVEVACLRAQVGLCWLWRVLGWCGLHGGRAQEVVGLGHTGPHELLMGVRVPQEQPLEVSGEHSSWYHTPSRAGILLLPGTGSTGVAAAALHTLCG